MYGGCDISDISGASYIRRSAIKDVLSYRLCYHTPILTSLSAYLCEVVPTLFISLSLPQVFSVIQVFGLRQTCFPTFIHIFRLTATRIIQAAPLLSYHTYISIFILNKQALVFHSVYTIALLYIRVSPCENTAYKCPFSYEVPATQQ